MRILISSVSYPPNVSGVAVSTQLLATHLAAAGHEVTVVTSSPFPRSSVEIDRTHGIVIYRLRSLPNPWRKGFSIPFLPDAEVADILEEVQPDIVHLQDPTRTSYTLCLEARQRRIPVVITNHFTLDYVLAYFPKRLREFVAPIVRRRLVNFYNLCDGVTCATTTVARILRSQGVARPIYTLTNGVDIHRFYSYVSLTDLEERYQLPAKPVVLYLGRMDREKSLPTLIHAIPTIIAQTPAHFVLAGGGSRRRSLQRLVKKLGISEHVTFTGAIPHSSELLVALYQAADIFVMPSAIETQSIVTMEAMAAGKPIVAANGCALPELVVDGENGYLFSPGDSQALAEKTIALLQNEELRQKMSVASLNRIANHELENALSMYAELYSAMCIRENYHTYEESAFSSSK